MKAPVRSWITCARRLEISGRAGVDRARHEEPEDSFGLRVKGSADLSCAFSSTGAQFHIYKEEGFQMSRDEYLKGNLSLTIVEADFSKRKWYTCKCDGEDICDVSLRLEPFSYPLSVRVGESLTLDLPIPDDVEVTVKKTDGPNTFSLCKIVRHKAWCESGYEQRASVSSSLRLKEVKNDDGGIYIIRDIKNDEVIGMYTVTVNGTKRDVSDGLPVEGKPTGHSGSVARPLAAVFGALLVVAVLVIVVLFLKNQRLRKCLRRKENVSLSMAQAQQQEQQEEQVEDEPEAVVHIPVMETEDGQEIIEQIKIQQDEADPLLETDSPANPPSVTEDPPLSVPVLDSCSQYSDSQTRVFS
ncbi:hypothetical protein AOLI_G00274600 [Acnodon oligacanthus]